MHIRKSITVLALVLVSSCRQKKAEGPIILNVSPSAHAGDIVYLQGANLGKKPLVEFSYNDSNWQHLTPISNSTGFVTVRLPRAGQPAMELVTIRASSDGKNWSEPAYINRARGVHFGTADVVPGGTIRVFGRNLFYPSRQPTARFVDTDDNSSFDAQAMGQGDAPYELVLKAPANLVPGHSYAVFLSNGYNGRSDSGGEVKVEKILKCRAPGADAWDLGVPWAADLTFSKNVFNVRSDPRLKSHAQADGSTNDLPAIQEAVAAASKAGGGVVFLPSGAYKVEFPGGCGIGLESRVVIAGAGMSQTTVNYGYGPAPKSGGYAVCFASELSGLVDITFKNINESTHWPQSALAVDCKKLFLQRVGWDIGTSQWITLTHSDNLAIENSRITQGIDAGFNYNGPLELSDSTHFLIKGNSITYAVWGLDLGNMRDGVFEGNTIIRDATDPSAAKRVTHVISANFTFEMAVLNNRFLVKGTLPANNDGETILSEGGGPYQPHEARGVIGSAKAETITDESNVFSSTTIDPNLRARPALVIVSGKGFGQWRTISSVATDGHSITVDMPWNVEPAAGDHYAVVNWSAADWIIAGNTMSDNQKGIEIFNASARDILITHNTMTDNSGVMISPDQRAPNGFNATYGIEVSDNVITDGKGLRPAYISIVPREDSQTSAFGTAVLGVEVRRNKLVASRPNTMVQHTDDEKAVVEGFNCYWQWQTAAGKLEDTHIPVVLGAIFQGNTVVNSDTAFYLNSGSYQTNIDGTMTQDVHTILRDDVIPGATHASVGTVVRGTSSATEADALHSNDDQGSGRKSGSGILTVGRRVSMRNREADTVPCRMGFDSPDAACE